MKAAPYALTARRALKIASAAATVGLLCGFAHAPSSARVAFSSTLLVTAAPEYQPLAALRGAERFPTGAQLLRVQQASVAPLTSGFSATADADVSFDGNRVLFSARRSTDDPWQIWQLDLKDGIPHLVITAPTDVIRPLYLPDGKLVYAERTNTGFQMMTARLDGSSQMPLTHLPGSAIPSTVLRDGRILFEAGYPLGQGDIPELYLVYSDGSGVESYRCDHGTARWGGRQLSSGDVVFTHGAGLARFTSPLASEERLAAPASIYAGDPVETPSGALLLSTKVNDAGHYTLKLWKPGAATMQPLLAQPGVDLVQPAILQSRPVPNRHPSGLHDWKTANLLALNSSVSRDGNLPIRPSAVRVEALNSTKDNKQVMVLGTAAVEADGSFFIKIPGDTPIRFALLDAKGAMIRQEHGWFWSRGGEQRICVGCHAGPERAPDNRVPQVLLRTTTPLDLSHQDSRQQQATQGGN